MNMCVQNVFSNFRNILALEIALWIIYLDLKDWEFTKPV